MICIEYIERDSFTHLEILRASGDHCEFGVTESIETIWQRCEGSHKF